MHDRHRMTQQAKHRFASSISLFPSFPFPFSPPLLLAILITASLAALSLLLPAKAQFDASAYLPFVARNAAPASWPVVPTPLPSPDLKPSPTAAPSPTPTLAPADVRILSSSAFTKTLGSETFLFIVGEVGNAGPITPIRDLTIIAALLDAENKLVQPVTVPAYRSVLGPGETTPFRIMVPLPAGYATHTLSLDYHLTPEAPPPNVAPVATNIYTDPDSGWVYFLGEVTNTTGVNMAGVQAVVTLYDERGQVINVADSGRGAGSLYEDVIGVGQKRPFRIVLRHGPSDYAALRWQVAYRATEEPAPAPLPIRVGYVAQESGVLRDESGAVIGDTQWFEIYGEVENTTQFPIRAVQVYAAFYTADGRVMNAGLVQSLHGRLGSLLPGDRTPFHVTISTGPIPDTDTPRFLAVTYEPAYATGQDQITITSQRAYREVRSIAGTPVEWLNVVGEVRNDGSESLQDVRVVATFYDATGRVVNAMAGGVFRPTLPAGATAPFRLRTAAGLLVYDYYTLDVTARTARAGTSPNLVLELQEPSSEGGPAVFQGQVWNASDQVVTHVTVFAALYDADGQVLVADAQVVAEEMPPGETVPFTLRVEGGVDGWQTYDIGVVSR